MFVNAYYCKKKQIRRLRYADSKDSPADYFSSSIDEGEFFEFIQKNQNQVGFHLYQKHLLFLVTTSKLKTTMYFWVLRDLVTDVSEVIHLKGKKCRLNLSMTTYSTFN